MWSNLIMRWVVGLFLLVFCVFIQAKTSRPVVMVLPISGAIGPATQHIIEKTIIDANKQNASALVLQLDTPGGLVKSTRGIVKAILASSVPVITYVAPSGARAASAGTYILYASAIAAMAPGTNLGAATPISLFGSKQTQEKTASKAHQKAINDASAYLQSLAQLHGRNVTWAKAAVVGAESLPAQQALKMNVINVIASDMQDLLKQINGMTVKTATGMHVLPVTHPIIQVIKPNWHSELLAIITDPSIAYILLLVGVYGLFFEFSTPGFVAPGVIGAVALLLALYALQLLPMNYVGLSLLLLGIGFMAAEALSPTIGVLGVGGVVAFAAGSLLLFDRDSMMSIAWPLVVCITLLSIGFFIMVFQLALRSRHQPIVSGAEQLIGLTAVVEQTIQQEWMIRLEGDRWMIKSSQNVVVGQRVKVVATEGIVLVVESVDE